MTWLNGPASSWTTNLEEALADPNNQVFFDASSTLHRARFVEMAAKAGKAVYCEKPTAVTTDEALRLAKLCEDAGVKNGAVQDKLWLPGIRKLKILINQGFFGRFFPFAESSDTGYSPVTTKTSQLSVRVGTTERKTEGNHELICFVTGGTLWTTFSVRSKASCRGDS